MFIHKSSAVERTRYRVTRVITLSLPLFLSHFYLLSVILDDSLGCLTCRDWSRKGSPARIPPPIPFNPFVYLFFFLGGGFTGISFDFSESGERITCGGWHESVSACAHDDATGFSCIGWRPRWEYHWTYERRNAC